MIGGGKQREVLPQEVRELSTLSGSRPIKSPGVEKRSEQKYFYRWL